uniref:Uncharacterized protein n=1 Tax=Tanacetum cinerariifolium TaxID=118510 RepID=A0A6L2M630_TANCI|nr:hypothetical protein [Tanacetum cinerariifolium]
MESRNVVDGNGGGGRRTMAMEQYVWEMKWNAFPKMDLEIYQFVLHQHTGPYDMIVLRFHLGCSVGGLFGVGGKRSWERVCLFRVYYAIFKLMIGSWKEASQLFVEGLSVVDELYGVQVSVIAKLDRQCGWYMLMGMIIRVFIGYPVQRQYILLFQKDLFNFSFFKLALGGITAHVRMDLDMGTHWDNSWSIQGVVEP